MNITSISSKIKKGLTLPTVGLFIFALITGFTAVFLTPVKTNALNGSDFKPGRIIDDSVFYNSDSMTQSQIQNFLDSKVPSCDTDGSKSYSYHYRASPLRLNDSRDPWVTTTRAVYGQRVYQRDGSKRGSRAPYTCLKEYRQTTVTLSPDSGLCDGYVGASNESAAAIIYKVARSCGVNPQVILVTLQKEQSLITDDWPWGQQYLKAMGMNCPDSELSSEDDVNNNGCEDWSEGFYRQVYYGTRQFKVYKANQTGYNYRAGRNNTILYNPNTNCGSSTIYIENQATAALYIYTPYRPNKAALDNLYGTGDSCSSYGVRNFWRMFNDWFGPTTDTPLFRIGDSSKIYILGSQNNYYYIPNQTILKAYGHGTSISKVKLVGSNYVSGKVFSGNLPLVAHFGGPEVYMLSGGKAHHVTSQAMLEDFGYTSEDTAYLREYDKSYFRTDDDMQQMVHNSGGPHVWFVQDGKKHHITGSTAYNTMGDPVYSSRDSVSLSEAVMNTIPDGYPILSSNQILKTMSGSYSFWDGSKRQNINSQTAAELGLTPNYQGSSAAINQLPTGGAENISKLVKNDVNFYILDNKKKLQIESSELASLGLTSNSFTDTSSQLLSRVPSDEFFSVFKIQNSAAVYLADDGERHHVFSKAALNENGYSLDQVISLLPSSAAVFPDSGEKIFSLGTLFRITGTDKVFVVGGQQSKLHVSSRSMLSDYGFSMDEVLVMPVGTGDRYSENGQLGHFVKDSNSSNVWLISNTKKMLVSPQMQSSERYDINVAALPLLDSQVLDTITSSPNLTEVVKSPNHPHVYKIENGEKRWIVSKAALSAEGYTTNDITAISDYLLSKIPSGDNIGD